MELPSSQETLQLLNAILTAEKKKAELLAANKAAARALLSSIPAVAYVTTKKNESTE